MTRTRHARPLLALGLVATAVAVVFGCGETRTTNPPGSEASSGAAGAKSGEGGASASKSGPGLAALDPETWPVPAAALVLTGQLDGYLEPCGCSDVKKGGLGRRYDLLERLRAKNWPVAPVDLGGILKEPVTARGGPLQSQVKLAMALQAFGMMDYDALALGAEELKLGVQESYGRLSNKPESLRILSANVTQSSDLDFPPVVEPKTVLEVGALKIGVTAVLDPAQLESLSDPDLEVFFEVKPPREALEPVLAELAAESDHVLLLVNGPATLARELAAAFPNVELIVCQSEEPEPRPVPETLNDGRTLLFNVGRKGLTAGVLAIYPDQPERFRYQRVILNAKYQYAEPIVDLLDREYQEQLRQVGAVENYDRRVSLEHAPGATYVGARNCKQCHPATYNFWANSKHARAYESLIYNPKRDRRHDAECISCHTTGFEYESGWINETRTAHLKGNQCENCHGPGSLHVADPENLEYRKFMARDADRIEQSNFCLKCHDQDNSPGFKFREYWPKIRHTGMDTYNRPEVRRGITPDLSPDPEATESEAEAKAKGDADR